MLASAGSKQLRKTTVARLVATWVQVTRESAQVVPVFLHLSGRFSWKRQTGLRLFILQDKARQALVTLDNSCAKC